MRDEQLAKRAEAVGWAQKALVMAVAQNRARRERAAKLSDQIVELEKHTALALYAGNEAVVEHAAEAIAWLESARDCESAVLSQFAQEFAELRRVLRAAKVRLKQRQRGSRGMEESDAVWWRRDQGPSDAPASDQASFGAAETALARLYGRQAEFDRVKVVLGQLDAGPDVKAIVRTIADAGYPAPAREKVREVSERLRTVD